jgi:hypothetical protein
MVSRWLPVWFGLCSLGCGLVHSSNEDQPDAAVADAAFGRDAAGSDVPLRDAGVFSRRNDASVDAAGPSTGDADGGTGDAAVDERTYACTGEIYGMRQCGVVPLTSGSVDCGACAGDARCTTIADLNLCMQCKPGALGVHQGDLSLGYGFDGNYPFGIRKVTGSVHVNESLPEVGGGATGALGCLQRVEGDLYIHFESPYRPDLSGLSALVEVGGSLVISSTGAWPHDVSPPGTLQSLDGLQNLKRVGGDLRIGRGGFTNLHGLEQLEHVGGALVIESAPVTTLEHLTSLTHVGALELRELVLQSLAPLSQLAPVERVALVSLPNLQSLAGLPFAAETTSIQVQYLPELTSLTGLESVVRTGELFLDYAPKLTSLAALSQLQQVDAGLTLASLPAVTSLAFDDLQSVGGVLVLSGLGLTDLAGFGAPHGVTSLRITQNPQLVALAGATALGQVTSLELTDNPKLQSVSELASLPSTMNDVRLANLPQLVSLDGFENVQQLTGPLSLERLAALTALAGLHELTSVHGGILLAELPELRDLQALSKLTATKLLRLYDLPKLESLAGLEHLRTVEGSGSPQGLGAFAVRIMGCARLSDLDALAGVTSLGAGLEMLNNPELTACALSTLATALGAECRCPEFHDAWVRDVPRDCECTVDCVCPGNDPTTCGP